MLGAFFMLAVQVSSAGCVSDRKGRRFNVDRRVFSAAPVGQVTSLSMFRQSWLESVQGARLRFRYLTAGRASHAIAVRRAVLRMQKQEPTFEFS